MTKRFYYCREHNHPLGWSVMDAETKAVIAYGSKGICAEVAGMLNGEEPSGLIKWEGDFMRRGGKY